MYYEERLIDGCLCYRTSPTGEWVQMTLAQVTKLYQDLQKEVLQTCEVMNEYIKQLQRNETFN